MDYLNKVLGINVVYENSIFKQLPNFIRTRYRLQMARLDEKKVIFLYPETELEQIGTLRKHIVHIQNVENLPVVLVLKEITWRQKEYLIRERIPFVVENKQIYLPFMALYLQERCSAEKQQYEEILPSAQLLLLYFIYSGAQELSTSQASKELGLTPTSISRASRQLEEMKLVPNKKNRSTKNTIFYGFAKRIIPKSAEEIDKSCKTDSLYSKGICKVRAIGKWLFSIG